MSEPTLEQRVDALERKVGSIDRITATLMRDYARESCFDEPKEPAEPLIKDEKVRKAVRAWAEADGADEKIYLTIDDNGSRFANKYGGYIEFAFQINMEEGLYTTAELCGEEEE